MPPQNDGLGVRFGERHDHPRVLDGLAILTAASTHDSQVAIPLARTSEQRVVWGSVSDRAIEVGRVKRYYR